MYLPSRVPRIRPSISAPISPLSGMSAAEGRRQSRRQVIRNESRGQTRITCSTHSLELLEKFARLFARVTLRTSAGTADLPGTTFPFGPAVLYYRRRKSARAPAPPCACVSRCAKRHSRGDLCAFPRAERTLHRKGAWREEQAALRSVDKKR